jgi:hypothetical protein
LRVRPPREPGRRPHRVAGTPPRLLDRVQADPRGSRSKRPSSAHVRLTSQPAPSRSGRAPSPHFRV